MWKTLKIFEHSWCFDNAGFEAVLELQVFKTTGEGCKVSGTLVVRMDAEAAERLYEELGHGLYQFRPMDHALWAGSGEDVNVVYYKSGKLVVQGKGATAFADRYRAILGDEARVEPTCTSPGKDGQLRLRLTMDGESQVLNVVTPKRESFIVKVGQKITMAKAEVRRWEEILVAVVKGAASSITPLDLVDHSDVLFSMEGDGYGDDLQSIADRLGFEVEEGGR